jgi:hypothetical protein
MMFFVGPLLQFLNPIVIGLTLLYGLCLMPFVERWDPDRVDATVLFLQRIYSPEAKAMGMILMLIGTFVYFYQLLVTCMDRRMWKAVPFLFLVPFYWLSQSLAQWLALRDFCTNAGWAKTDHTNEEAAFRAAPSYSLWTESHLTTSGGDD